MCVLLYIDVSRCKPNTNDARKHGGFELQYTNLDRPSMTREFDKQPRGDASLARKIHVVLRYYDCNRPVLKITRNVHGPI